ncbi:MAG TPA: VIT and VWA domain-containing protein [Bryobacteraceae bacterium]|nr:VIT and VWA domain-containing protein [Bryobacteraceae bacterium]
MALTETSPGFAPLSAQSGKQIELTMQRLWLTGRVLSAGARLLIQHVFQCAETKPVEIIYAFPLPRDAALRRFTIRGEGFTAHSELKPTEDALRDYELGIEQGSLSTLARQHGDGMINLSVGNIRPGETVTVTLEILAGVESRDDGYRFRFPFTLAPAYHARARMLEMEPGAGEMELPEDEFGDVVLPKFRQDPGGLHGVGFDLRLVGALAEIGSPSHGVRVRLSDGEARVSLAREKDVPNRDLVLDAKRAWVKPEVLGGDGQFVATIPSTTFGANPDTRRRVVIVLDRSGSMQGAPIQQARKAIEACLGALSAEDEFGLIAFDDRTEVFQPSLTPGTKENRKKAGEFLRAMEARGGTELTPAVDHAARICGGEADVLILTDGQVAGTEQILGRARAAGIRLHTLGIGSASQDRFLRLLARETGGVSRFVTAQERVDLTAVDLFASLGRPVASEVNVTGVAAQPDPPSHVFAGTPFVCYGEAQVGATLHVVWAGGSMDVEIPDAGPHTAGTLRLLRGARLITDFESRYSMAGGGEDREVRRIKDRIQTLSLTYGLASREMSLVAVVKREGDKAGEVPTTKVVPVAMPQDTRFESYFSGKVRASRSARVDAAAVAGANARWATARTPVKRGIGSALFSLRRKRADTMAPEAVSALPSDPLFDLAAAMDDDGGMPGNTFDERVLRTVLAVLAFLNGGHSRDHGAFRSHVRRLVNFLVRNGGNRELAAEVVERARTGKPVAGDWLRPTASWKDIEEALH